MNPFEVSDYVVRNGELVPYYKPKTNNIMKLNEFNVSNSRYFANKKDPRVRFNKKAGLISFSIGAEKLLDFKKGDKVIILQDEENPEDWYINKTQSKSGFALRIQDDQKGVTFNCSFIVKRILDSLGFEGKSCSMPISKNPIDNNGEKYYLIITSNINESSRIKETT